jgi:hypothetical protein
MNPERDVSTGWKKFVRNHWGIVAFFVVAGVFAIIGVFYVLLWFVKDAQTTSLLPSTLALWTTANLVSFILYLIFWELVFIGIPVLIVGLLGWAWWRRLPSKEKAEYELVGRGSHRRRAGGGLSALVFIGFLIKVYVDGNWNVAISTWTLNYVVGSLITVIIWLAVIFGIPAAIVSLLWIRHELHKKP